MRIRRGYRGGGGARGMSGWACLLVLGMAGACHAKSGYEIAWLAIAGGGGNYPTDGEPAEDAEVESWLTSLDSLLSLPATAADFHEDALQAFGRYIQMARLTPRQTWRIASFLEEVGERHPDSREPIDGTRYLVVNLTPGKVAPNIVGEDTEGVPFQLVDYRGNIVVLIFSGDWCGPCHAEYPYQRRMLNRYKDEKVVLLGVNSDEELLTIRNAKARERLDYRTWWDGSTDGPIASSWHISRWPSTFILDEDGVIMHVNRRGNEIIKAVDRLLEEMAADGSM